MEEENSKRQKEKCQENLMAELALSVKEQIHKHAKKEENYKLKLQMSNSGKTKKSMMRKEPQNEDNSGENVSPLLKFAKQNFGFELTRDASDEDRKPSGKCSFSERGMDIASLNIFENQVISVEIHNISKSFKQNLATI